MSFLSFCPYLNYLFSIENTVHTAHGPVTYTTETGWLPGNLQDNKGTGSLFYVSYSVPSKRPRPITFCFNGGPGSASAWLHIGAFGPRRLELPSAIVDNIHTLLPATDLIFVDPVSTGFSRANDPASAGLFFNFQSDGYYLADFISTYLRTHDISNSPLFLLGSSFATIRIIEIARNLDRFHCLPVNGLVMISTFLNYESMIDPLSGNDYPYLFTLPTYAAASFYHGISQPKEKELMDWVREAKKWSWTDYRQALQEGDSLAPKKRREIAEKISYFTGIPAENILRERLRLSPSYFFKELLRDKQRTIGRFDVRYMGIDGNASRRAGFDYDPSFYILRPLATGFLSYLQTELKFAPLDYLAYYFLGIKGPWSYVEEGSKFLSMNRTLRDLFQKQPHLQLFVASGIFDIATPFAATEYDIAHLGLSQETHQQRIHHHLYEGGHMLYTENRVLSKLSDDIIRFLSEAAFDNRSKKFQAKD